MKTIFIVMRVILLFKQVLGEKERQSSVLCVSNGTLVKGNGTMSCRGLETPPDEHLSYSTVHVR